MAAEDIINGWVSSPNSRGTLDIIWSSLFTIFLSTWTALHLNVPSPYDGFLTIAFRKFKWMLLTALMPEMTVMFALAQWIQAKKTARFLQEELGCHGWGIAQGFYVEMGGLSAETQVKRDTPRRICVDGSIGGSTSEREGPPVAKQRAKLAEDVNQRSLENTHPGREAEESLEIGVLPTSAPEPESLKEPNVCHRARWGLLEKLPIGTIQLKWLVERGYLERRDRKRKLNADDMVEVTRGEQRAAVPCIPDLSNSKIQEISRSDTVLRVMWVIQVCWYLLQCIARATQHLSVSLLELSTVALIICAIIIQILWWHKPLDVQSSTSILIDKMRLDDYETSRTIRFKEEKKWRGSGGYGGRTIQYEFTRYKYKTRVNNDTTTSNRAVLALPIVGLIFGGMHMIAWKFYFHTELERHLWRVFTILVAGAPIALTAIERFGYCLDLEDDAANPMAPCFRCLKYVLLLVYAASRMYLIAMSFVSLRHLPESAYQTVQWANYLPHF